MTTDTTPTYTAIADWFDQNRTRSLMEKPYLDAAIVACGNPKGGAALDLGCGTAEPLAAYLIARGFDVTGIDSAAPMIDYCRQRFPDHDWQMADVRHLALGRTFDLIIAWHSFFHLPAEDQRAMFAVFAAHLHGGGALVFTSGPDEGVAWGEMQGHSVHHASLSPTEYRQLAATHGFEVVHHAVDDADCGGATVWIMRKTVP